MTAIPSTVKRLRAPDGAAIEYEILGSGEPLVMLHGTFVGRRAFSRQRELAERYRLVLVSARGHDNSELLIPRDYGLATTEKNDVHAVAEAEGLKRFSLLGHSTGGAVAFAYCREFPERVKRLILIEPTMVALLPPAGRSDIAASWGRLIGIGLLEGAPNALRALMDFLGGPAWAALDDHKRAAALDAMASLAPLVVPNLLAVMGFKVSEADVRGLQVPVLLIYGDASFPFEALLASQFRELRPDWPILIAKGASHSCFREQPALVNATIKDFLSGD